MLTLAIVPWLARALWFFGGWGAASVVFGCGYFVGRLNIVTQAGDGEVRGIDGERWAARTREQRRRGVR